MITAMIPGSSERRGCARYQDRLVEGRPDVGRDDGDVARIINDLEGGSRCRNKFDLRPILAAMVNTQFDRITVNPDRLGGKPCIRGLRISVGMVVQMVAAGKTIEEIISEYPYLEAEDVRQALAYSAALAENEYHLALRPSA
jgi:uncharacterized protein (DUF433 family)